MSDIQSLLKGMASGDHRSLARAITVVENELPGHKQLLGALNFSNACPIIGVTGPPGAGKSTVINNYITALTAAGKRVGVIAVDPTSPFNFGSLLGDRLRMSEHFNNPNVFIRSLATRGSLGGLSAKAIEVSDVMRTSGFDAVILETVGVGQSEVEIAGLADVTILVLVPEAGDEVQAIKSGVMEIADVFVVNKSDRPGANTFLKNLHGMVSHRNVTNTLPQIVKTIGIKNEGTIELISAVELMMQESRDDSRALLLYADKAYRLIQEDIMRKIDRKLLLNQVNEARRQGDFHLYRFVESYLSSC